MSIGEKSPSEWKEISHVGILVDDIEKAARGLEKLIGIGPFRIFEPEYRDTTYQGKPAKFRVKIALAKAGAIDVELMQRVQGETIYDDAIRRKGYGIHHIGIRTGNIEQTQKEMEEKGFRVVQSGNRPGVKWAYLDTEPKTGVIVELHEKKETS